MALSSKNVWLVLLVCLVLFTCRAHAFGAGNIASISAVEGKNWRHGDIEDILKTVACIRHHKWNSMMMKRVYFGYVQDPRIAFPQALADQKPLLQQLA